MDPNDETEARPAWTLFFDGDLYQRYQDYSKSHDFSKILMNNRNSISSNTSYVGDYPMHHHTNWFKSDSLGIHENGLPQMFGRLPSSDKFLTQSDARKRWRRTVMVIVMGFLILGGVAAAAALIIHFVFVDDTEVISKQVNFTIPGNETSRLQQSGTRIDATSADTGQSGSVDMTTSLSEKLDDDLSILEAVISNRTDVSLQNQLKVLLGNTDVAIENNGILVAVSGPTTPGTSSTVISTMTQNEHGSPFSISTTSATLTGREIIRMNDVTGFTNVGTPSLMCEIQFVKSWSSISIVSNTPSAVEVSVSRKGKITWKSATSRLGAVYSTSEEHIGETTLRLSVLFNKLLCEDEGVYTCSLHADSTINQYATLTVESKPSKTINLMIPAEIVSHQVLKMTAVWNSGLPATAGNLTWSITKAGDGITSFKIDDVSWHVSSKDCETEVKSIATITPTMTWNGTQVTVSAVLDSSDVDLQLVQPARDGLLIVPSNYCRGRGNDTSIPHPYTCNKYVRCFADRMVVYPCPANLCFNPENGSCDYKRET